MKKISLSLTFCILFASIAFSQTYSKFRISGYRVNIIPHETFHLEIKDGVEAIRVVEENNILKLMVKDQTGRVPKDTLNIYTKDLSFLEVHNCEIVMKTPFHSDSLILKMASSSGNINFNGNYLLISAEAGSNLVAEGTFDLVNYVVGAASHVNSKELTSNETNVNVMGYSSLIVNTKSILKRDVKNASFSNVSE